MWEGIYDGFLKTPGRAQRVNRLEPDDWAPHILEDSDVVHGEATVATQADVPRMLAALLNKVNRIDRKVEGINHRLKAMERADLRKAVEPK
jgi:hypothetical protein